MGFHNFCNYVPHYFSAFDDLLSHTRKKRAGLFYMGLQVLDAVLAVPDWLPAYG